MLYKNGAVCPFCMGAPLPECRCDNGKVDFDDAQDDNLYMEEKDLPQEMVSGRDRQIQETAERAKAGKEAAPTKRRVKATSAQIKEYLKNQERRGS